MDAIVGESLFYEVSRIIRRRNDISFYQYKALDSFIEIITLHNRVALLVGEEADSDFIKSFEWLIGTIHEKTDCTIDIISSKRRDQYITNEVMALFEKICKEIYSHSLGITSDDLFKKIQKDRTSEDMSERIEQIFIRDYPKFNCKKFGEGISEILEKNANSSELLYFFRAHLFQAIAELQSLTPFYENQRLIAAIFQQRCRPGNKEGTLPYTIYKMANGLFIKANDSLPDDKAAYPRVSILLNAVVEGIESRSEIIDSIIALRNELKEFRQAYYDAEKVLCDPNKSLYERSEIQRSLDESVRQIWMPVVASLGRSYSSSKVVKILKGVFGKYGVGEMKFQHEEKKGSSENKATYATPSLTGVITTLAQSATEVYKDSKLMKPNKSLLELILRVAKLTDTRRRLDSLLPVRGFSYRLPRLIDSFSVRNLEEAA